MTRELTVGIGAEGIDDSDLLLDLGNGHPSTHGALRLALVLDGEQIVRAEPIVGYLHRGAEKLFEVRDYRQIVVLANRHDWLSAFSNELGIVLAVEAMMGMTVPDRAVWLRTLLAELNRVLSHLVFLGAPPIAVGTAGPREAVQRVMEEACGGRIHFMFNRVGGVKEDVPAGWTGRVRQALAEVRRGLEPVEVALQSEAFVAKTSGVGVMAPETVLAHGVSGPVARASGVDVDLRRDDPYLAYPSLPLTVPLGSAGDSHDRFRCLLDQTRVSLHLVEACLDRLPGGPVNVRLPKTVRAPEGSIYRWTESPLGAMGYYLVSRGGTTPWRLAMRTPSFNNASALSALLPGVGLADLVTVLASMFFVIGDIDK